MLKFQTHISSFNEKTRAGNNHLTFAPHHSIQLCN